MNYRLTNTITGIAVLLIAFIVALLTVQPSVSFWDCGEFIAASFTLQVPHPPGTPFFLLLGRIFSMIPFADNIAFRVNMISVLSSAFAVFFLYHIIIKLIENYRGLEPKNTLDAVTNYVAGIVGALSLAFADTFWFNAVEAEVYANSTFIFGFIMYLAMVWNEKADEKGNEKYLLLAFYLIGLSTAVHLMSVLAVITVVMIIMFKKYITDDEALMKSGYLLMIHVAIILVVAFFLWAGQTGTQPVMQSEYQDFDSKFRMIIVAISALFMGVFYKKIFNKNSIYIPLMIGGAALFITYPGIVKYVPSIMADIAGNDITTELLLILAILGGLGYATYWSVKNQKHTAQLIAMGLIFIFIGFTPYAMVIIRANQDPPMNENEPKTFTELVSYLNREQYGDFPTWKRRYASDPHQMVVYNNYNSDLEFWWRYQMNHMMTRYLLWNYGGREGWNQDQGPNIAPFNAVGNLFGKAFGIRFGGTIEHSLFGIPFILGLLGIYFHFRKDWKMAAAFMVLFIFMSYLTAYYQNQQQPQPRERDYFYVGGFFVFSIWVGLSIRGIVDFIQEKISGSAVKNAAITFTLVAALILVPVRMLQANYYTHDRSDNWVPWDYAYNLLQSCATDAVLFTNGDNDTFPLWYMQDVEGVRRDIRVANLSLLNTHWYIKQLKNLEPYGAKKVAMRFSDAQIDQIRPVQWETQTVNIPIPSSAYEELSSSELYQHLAISDTSQTLPDHITFTFAPTVNYQGISAIRTQDILVREIVEANNWERPIYFAVTCSENSKIGLGEYLQMEGMASRLVPYKRERGVEYVNEKIMRMQLFCDDTSDSKTYKPGFNFRGLNDPDIFLDDTHDKLIQNYRNAFIRLSLYYTETEQNEKAIESLDRMEVVLPRELNPMDYRLLFDIGSLYFEAGEMDKYIEIASEVEEEALAELERNPQDISSYYNPYRLLLDTYTNLEEFDKAVEVLKRAERYFPNNPSIKDMLQSFEMRQMMKEGKIDPDSLMGNEVPGVTE